MILEKARFVLGQIAHGMIRPQKEINEAVDTVFDELDKRIWIPVTERLPEKEGRYLVTNSRIGSWIIDVDQWFLGHWRKNNKPVAWMPLPESYEHDQR